MMDLIPHQTTGEDCSMEYSIEDGFNSMDFRRVTEMLTTAFWSPGIQIDEVIHGATHSALVAGVFDSQHRQIGYARVISDMTRFAYILDVIVDEGCRTKDAHEVYKKVGFKVTERANDWMDIRKPRKTSA
jgi:hypothetical protein